MPRMSIFPSSLHNIIYYFNLNLYFFIKILNKNYDYVANNTIKTFERIETYKSFDFVIIVSKYFMLYFCKENIYMTEKKLKIITNYYFPFKFQNGNKQNTKLI